MINFLKNKNKLNFKDMIFYYKKIIFFNISFKRYDKIKIRYEILKIQNFLIL